MYNEPMIHGSSEKTIMETTDFVKGRELQKVNRTINYPHMNRTYKDVFGEFETNHEIYERFSRKNLDFATFAKPGPASVKAITPVRMLDQRQRHQDNKVAGRSDQLNTSLIQQDYQNGNISKGEPQEELDKLQSSVIHAAQRPRPPSGEGKKSSSLPRLNNRDYQLASPQHPSDYNHAPFGIMQNTEADYRMRDSVKKFYGYETPKEGLTNQEARSNSITLMRRQTPNKMLSNSAIILDSKDQSRKQDFELQRSANQFSNVYDQMNLDPPLFISGQFMKVSPPKTKNDEILTHLRQQSAKRNDSSYANLALKLVEPYKNETRKKKIMFCEHSPIIPRSNIGQYAPSNLSLT